MTTWKMPEREVYPRKPGTEKFAEYTSVDMTVSFDQGLVAGSTYTEGDPWPHHAWQPPLPTIMPVEPDAKTLSTYTITQLHAAYVSGFKEGQHAKL